jgi:phytanoyl-CoA hydroxylase
MATLASPSSSAAADALQFDPGAELHAPELYRPTSRAFQVETLADIGPEEIAFYREHGYLAVRQAFTADEVEAAMTGLGDLVMGRRPDFKGVWFEAAAKEKLAELGAEERLDAVRKLGDFVDYDPRLKALSHHAGLLAVLTRLLGDRVPSMFQDMALLKPPRIGREKPWHQDHAYFDYPLDTPIVGVWIALDEATVDNGCMQILPGRHREPLIHFQRRDWQLCDKEVLGTESVAVPLPPGGLLLFDGKLPHGTPHNTSAKRRRAIQYHYRPDDAQKCATEIRLEAFGSEGKDVTC